MTLIEQRTTFNKLLAAKQHHQQKAAMHLSRHLHHKAKIREAEERLNTLAEERRDHDGGEQ